MASERLLLVDDDEAVRSGLGLVLEANGFEVTAAPAAPEALRLIAAHNYDVLLTDLHMPGPGDGLTVISAMRHTHPGAVTLLLSADPNLAKATAAILGQVDEVILKPVRASLIVERIRERLAHHPPPTLPHSEKVAEVLEGESAAIAEGWLRELARPASRTVAPVNLNPEERCEHLPDAMRDILFRLRYPQPAGASTLFSMSALQHGARRRRQGIGASTLVEESRALQVTLFRILEAQQDRIDASQLAPALMTIADEVNAQLLQAIEGYENEQSADEPSWGFR